MMSTPPHNPPEDPVLRRCLNAVGGLFLLVGAMVLVGRFTGLTGLVRVVPNGAPMAFTTAVAFVLCAGGFFAAAGNRRRELRWFGCAGIIAGGSTLLLHALAAQLNVDSLVYAPGRAMPLGFSGRMAPNAAASFALLGAAFVLMAANRVRLRLLGLLASLLMAIAFVALCGYVTGLRAAEAWWRYTGMALHTSVLFTVAAGGVLLWVVRRAPLEEAPMARSLPFFSTAGGVIFIIGLISYVTSVVQEESAHAVARVWEVQANIDRLIAPLARVDTAVRNFVLTGEARYLERREEHRADVERQLEILSLLMADRPSQAARVATLRILIARRAAIQDETLRVRSEGGVAAAAAVLQNQPPEISAEINRMLGELQAEETGLLAQREQETTRRLRSMRLTLVAGMLLTVGLTGVAFQLLRRAQLALRDANLLLERRVAERTRDLEDSNARLRESERSWRFLADSMPQLVWTARPDGEGESVNRGWVDYTGLSLEASAGDGWSRVVHPEDVEASASAWREMIRTGQPGSGESRLRRASDGVYRWHLWRAQPERDASGRILRWVGTSTDIHEQRSASEALERRVAERTRELATAQAELQAVNRLQRAVLDGTRFGIIATDAGGVIQVFNTGAERMLGYRREEMIGRLTPTHLHLRTELLARADELSYELQQEVKPGFEVLVHKARASGGEEREWTLVRKDGTRLPVLLSVTALRDDAGTVRGFLGMVIDLSARKELESRIQKITSHVPGMVYEYRLRPDGQGSIPYASDGVRELFGVTPEQVRADPTLTFAPVHPEDRERLERSIAESRETLQPWRCEYRVRRPDGSVRWLLGHSTPEREADGTVVWHGVVTDITENKHVEQALQESEERLRLATEAAGLGVWQWTIASGELVWDAGMYRLYGREPHPEVSLVYRDWADAVVPQDLPEQERRLREMMQKGGRGQRDFRIRRPDGAIRHIQAAEMVVSDASGQPRSIIGINFDVTAQTLAEAAARESRERLATVFNTLAEGVVLQDASGRILACNPAAERILGLTRDQLSGRASVDPRWQAVHVDGSPWPGADHPAMVTLRTGQPLREEVMGVHKPDGSLTWISINSEPVRDASGAVRAVVASFVDTTERQRAEEALRASELRWSFALEGSGDGVWDWDMTTNRTFFSRQWKAMLGYAEHEVEHSLAGWEALVHPEDLPRAREAMERHIAGEVPVYEWEGRVRGKDGEYRWILGRGKILSRDASGRPLRVIGTHTDLTARKATERALQESEALFRNAFQVSPLGFGMTTLDGRWVEANEALCRITGYSRQELLGLHWQEMSLPDELPPDEQQVEALVRGEKALHSIEKRYRRKDGTLVWVRVVGTVVRSLDGRPLYGVAHIEDITQRREAAAALQQSEERFRQAFEFAGIGMALLDREGRSVRLNRALCELLGYTEEDLRRISFRDLTYSEDVDADVAQLDRLLAGERMFYQLEKRFLHRDGHLVWGHLTVSLVRDAAGQPVQFISQVQDITGRKQAEARLRAYAERLQEKNVELQEFAYAASHDLQEPLRKIQAFGDRLLRVAGPRLTGQELDYLERMRGAARRMSALIAALLAYSRVSTEARSFERVALRDVVRGVLQDLEIRLETTHGRVEVGELPVVSADRLQMHQLFLNLIGNALKYHRPDVPPEVRISARAMLDETGARGWEIVTEDNGIGFEPEYAETIFGVFQRLHTREQYEGAGVGLAICRRIIERHGGRIWAEGRPGEGSRFVFTLPATATSETRP